MRQSDYPALCKILQDADVMYAYEGAFNDNEVQEWMDKQINSVYVWSRRTDNEVVHKRGDNAVDNNVNS